MEIAIIGAGIGGLSAALALARTGHQIRIFEQAGAIEEIGAGLQIGANGCRILRHWGIFDALVGRASAAPHGWLGDGVSGRRLCTIPLNRVAQARWQQPHWQIHRADLQAALLEACRAEAGIDIRLNAALVGLEQNPSHIRLDFADGGSWQAELAVGADGTRSTLARLALGQHAIHYSGRVARRALIDPRTLDDNFDWQLPGIWMVPGGHLVHYPLRGGELLNLVACSNAPQPSATGRVAHADPAALYSVLGHLATPLQPLLHALADSPVWGLHEIAAQRPWYRHRAVLLGDAAHAMLPSMAQGAVMAMEDAVILARCLDDAGDLQQRLARYAAMRTPRVLAVQRIAERNMRAFHARGAMRQLQLTAMRLLGEAGEEVLGSRYAWVYAYDALSAQS